MSEMLVESAECIVYDVMSQNVIFVQDSDSLRHAAKVVEQFRISGVPVVNEYGHCVGVLSVKDVAKHSDTDETRLAVEDDVTVGQVMTTPAITVSPGLDVAEAGRIMCSRRVHRLPVVDETGLLVGLISSLDVIETLVCDPEQGD
ncbi:MAG: CBS domain-containing protein [Planctomycetales bacterium]|nr:CBS domain-containing protein [Planctomycetales bacterium]